MSELTRFKKDYSLDGWPIRDNENHRILSANDLVHILNDFDSLEKSIGKIKADAFKAGFSASGEGFNDEYGASEERVNELAIEYVEGRHE